VAYVATVTGPFVHVANDLRRYYVYLVTETGALDTSTYELTSTPSVGAFIQVTAQLTAGTGTTVQPEFGAITGWTDASINEFARVTTAAAFVNQSNVGNFATRGSSVWVRSSPNNAAGDHAITSRIVILEGSA
jgi:hypothetical protein